MGLVVLSGPQRLVTGIVPVPCHNCDKEIRVLKHVSLERGHLILTDLPLVVAEKSV